MYLAKPSTNEPILTRTMSALDLRHPKLRNNLFFKQADLSKIRRSWQIHHESISELDEGIHLSLTIFAGCYMSSLCVMFSIGRRLLANARLLNEFDTGLLYAHGEGRANTTAKNKFTNYIGYQRTSDGEHRTRLAVKNRQGYTFLTEDKEGKTITTENCWGKEEPLMKDVLAAYQAQWGITVKNTKSEDEAE
ncbi:hypothetical protein F25303_5232 [Fusarium sp. NRRL 25303]|nr:hypothetical protein F25303_5232 [Fusarium sp. NRRL 25303]